MASLLVRKTQLAASIEAQKGTKETLDATDATVLAENVTFDYSPEALERNISRGDLSTEQSIPGRKIATIGFRTEIKGSGTAGTAPSFGKLLAGCGFDEVLSASTSAAYNPDSVDTATETLTIGVNVDGVLWEIYGARGNVSFTFTANQICYADWSFTGIFNDFSAVALYSPTYESTVPVPWHAATFSLDFGTAWTTAVLSELTLDMGNQVLVRDNANATYGLSYAVITSRDPGGSVNLDQVTIATQDVVAFLETPTLGTMSFVLGASAGNILTVTAPQFQITGLPHGDRDGIAVWNTTYKLRRNAGDDEVVFTFT